MFEEIIWTLAKIAGVLCLFSFSLLLWLVARNFDEVLKTIRKARNGKK